MYEDKNQTPDLTQGKGKFIKEAMTRLVHLNTHYQMKKTS